MSTNWNDVAHDLYVEKTMREEAEQPPPRDRTYESAQHVLDSVVAWLRGSGAVIARTHPQEIWAGKTPIGPTVRIAVQAARTPVESTLAGLVARTRRHPERAGCPVAVALPDLPRLRRECESLAAQSPEIGVTWLFVGRGGDVAVVPPATRTSESAAFGARA